MGSLPAAPARRTRSRGCLTRRSVAGRAGAAVPGGVSQLPAGLLADRMLVEKVMHGTAGNQRLAAKLLGVSRTTFVKMLRALAPDRSDAGPPFAPFRSMAQLLDSCAQKLETRPNVGKIAAGSRIRHIATSSFVTLVSRSWTSSLRGLRGWAAHGKSKLAAQLHISETVDAARTLPNNENLHEPMDGTSFALTGHARPWPC
jgi:hypothetical protein